MGLADLQAFEAQPGGVSRHPSLARAVGVSAFDRA